VCLDVFYVAATLVVATHANDFQSSRNFFAVRAAKFFIFGRGAGTDRISAFSWVRHNFSPHSFSRIAAHRSSELDAETIQKVVSEPGLL
jgi:hypothetical protein